MGLYMLGHINWDTVETGVATSVAVAISIWVARGVKGLATPDRLKRLRSYPWLRWILNVANEAYMLFVTVSDGLTFRNSLGSAKVMPWVGITLMTVIRCYIIYLSFGGAVLAEVQLQLEKAQENENISLDRIRRAMFLNRIAVYYVISTAAATSTALYFILR